MPRAAAPPTIDTSVASIARVYDAMLNGKDNYEVDRQVRSQLVEVAPNIQTMTRDNRDWLIRVSRYLAGEVGMEQFLDCGSGLRSPENTHQVVQWLLRTPGWSTSTTIPSCRCTARRTPRRRLTRRRPCPPRRWSPSPS